MDTRLRKLESDVAGINARLDAVLPTLATKADLNELRVDLVGLEAKLFKALNDQTWKFMGVTSGFATALVTVTYFIARNVH